MNGSLQCSSSLVRRVVWPRFYTVICPGLRRTDSVDLHGLGYRGSAAAAETGDFTKPPLCEERAICLMNRRSRQGDGLTSNITLRRKYGAYNRKHYTCSSPDSGFDISHMCEEAMWATPI